MSEHTTGNNGEGSPEGVESQPLPPKTRLEEALEGIKAKNKANAAKIEQQWQELKYGATSGGAEEQTQPASKQDSGNQMVGSPEAVEPHPIPPKPGSVEETMERLNTAHIATMEELYGDSSEAVESQPPPRRAESTEERTARIAAERLAAAASYQANQKKMHESVMAAIEEWSKGRRQGANHPGEEPLLTGSLDELGSYALGSIYDLFGADPPETPRKATPLTFPQSEAFRLVADAREHAKNTKAQAILVGIVGRAEKGDPEALKTMEQAREAVLKAHEEYPELDDAALVRVLRMRSGEASARLLVDFKTLPPEEQERLRKKAQELGEQDDLLLGLVGGDVRNGSFPEGWL